MKETSRKQLGFLPRLGKHPYLEVFEQVTYDLEQNDPGYDPEYITMHRKVESKIAYAADMNHAQLLALTVYASVLPTLQSIKFKFG
jgi:hypothetical protein